MVADARNPVLLAEEVAKAGGPADVTMLIGNGYAYAHADFALELYRDNPAIRLLFDHRLGQPRQPAVRGL